MLRFRFQMRARLCFRSRDAGRTTGDALSNPWIGVVRRRNRQTDYYPNANTGAKQQCASNDRVIHESLDFRGSPKFAKRTWPIAVDHRLARVARHFLALPLVLDQFADGSGQVVDVVGSRYHAIHIRFD